MQVIERIAGHYDVRERPFGRDYRWSLEQVVIECSKCAKRVTPTRSQIIGSVVLECECGKANTARIREELVVLLVDEEYEAHHHPWFYDTQEQAKQHKRDEAAYPEDSPWRYNDVRYRSLREERRDEE
jgi:hypothetical protein